MANQINPSTDRASSPQSDQISRAVVGYVRDSTLRNARTPQPFHVVPSITILRERINLTELFHGKSGLNVEECPDVRRRFLSTPQMSKRRDQGLVAVDECGRRLNDATTDLDRLLILLLHQIGDRKRILMQREIGQRRCQLAAPS